MSKHGLIIILLIFATGVVLCQAVESENTLPFPVFPETTKSGDFLCNLWFWRGEPPCFKTTTMHGAYVRYPTRQKARIIVDSYIEEGLYPREILAAFFGTLMIGEYRPEGSAAVGDFWDSGYFGLVKLDYQIEGKNLLWDIVLQRNWAKGKFQSERYKALKVLASERLITLREYDVLKKYLEEEILKDAIEVKWTNALVTALSSFREWNEELLPLFRKVFVKLSPGDYRPVLQAFIDFNIPDDGMFILDNVLSAKVTDFADKQLCIRAAMILDDEYAYKRLTELADSLSDDETTPAEYKSYIENTLIRMNWYGRWEVFGTKFTWDDGLKGEYISFRMARSLNEADDPVDFSMPMQISDPEELLPIGTESTYLTNYVSFEAAPKSLSINKYIPYTKMTITKKFNVRKGTGRDEGRVYLEFPLEGEFDQRGNQKFGWIEIEKVS
ncbi:hypothetical protein JW823_00525 [bacterium]|nr:hypothetical protein [candidate division CSSED10-310 bacterium]